MKQSVYLEMFLYSKNKSVSYLRYEEWTVRTYISKKSQAKIQGPLTRKNCTW